MRRGSLVACSVTALLLGLATPTAGTPADQVRERIATFRELGSAYKAMADALRRSDPPIPLIQQAVARINQASQRQFSVFPAGSGPRPGVKTAAKPEIWGRLGEFRAAQDALARQASALQRAAATGDTDAIRAEARKLGGTCKSCHDNFRAPPD